MSSIRAAAVQLNHLPGDKETNLGKIQEFVRKAADEGVELLAFPEMCISGYWHIRNFPREAVEELAEPFPGGPSTPRLVDLAVDHQVTVGAGLIEHGAADHGRAAAKRDYGNVRAGRPGKHGFDIVLCCARIDQGRS